MPNQIRVGIWLILFFTSTALFAQPTQKPTQEQKEKYLTLIKVAETFYEADEFARALASYQEATMIPASSILSHWKVLYMMAQCHRQLNNYREAIDSYNVFLQATKNPQSNDLDFPLQQLRENAEQQIKELRTLFPEPTPSTQPEITASETLPTTTNTSPLTLPTETKFDPTTTPNEVNEVKTAKRSSLSLSTKLFYSSAASSAALGLVSAGTGFIFLSRANKLDNSGQLFEVVDIEKENLTASARTFATLADGLFLIAVGTGITGYLLARRDKKRAAKEKPITFMIAPQGVSLTVRY